ncbi:MAG TPA: iron ABC transporter permease [Dehalococcoidia bacterium]|jgi:iron complex transport system permease protein|nr:iron ABC transporter permease [Dehalococcoidia bacterium]
MARAPLWPRFLAGCVVLVGVALVALAVGPAGVPLDATVRILLSHLPGVGISEDVSPAWRNIIWEVRLPRVLLAGAAGATLAMAGATYQGVFRNPLADPYLIGVATGANLGATIVLVSNADVSAYGLSLLPLAAFAGALISVVVVYGIARAGGPASGTTMILAGVALSALSTAVTAYLMLTTTTNSLTLMSAVLGGFNTATWVKLAWVLPYAIPAAIVVLAHGRILNILSLDEQQARQLGIDVERTKLVLLGAASLAAAAAVSVAGTIGFVGLIVPHAIRLLWGPDNRSLLPMAIVLGAAFLIGTDVLARTIREPAETPVGIITVACGVPFFLYLLVRRSRVGM